MFHHYFAFFGRTFSYRGQNYNPEPSKRSQVQIWNVHKPWKIGIATRAQRSAVIAQRCRVTLRLPPPAHTLQSLSKHSPTSFWRSREPGPGAAWTLLSSIPPPLACPLDAFSAEVATIWSPLHTIFFFPFFSFTDCEQRLSLLAAGR